MADYALTITGTQRPYVMRRSDGALVPDDQNNADWQRYQAWLDAGNLPDPAPPLAPLRTIAPLAFRRRFSPAERAAIALAAYGGGGDPTLIVALEDSLAARSVELDDPNVAMVLGLFVSRGLIASSRIPQLLRDAMPDET